MTEHSSETSTDSNLGADETAPEAALVTEPTTPEALGLELPDDEDTAREMLLTEIATARSAAADYLDQLKRKAAEFDNYRKRTLREQAQIREFGAERLVSALLPALDSFEAALALPAETEAEQSLLAGMKATREQVMDALAREGLAPIPGVGSPFDPSVHEAISSPPDATGTLVVGHEVRRGYRLKDKVLRASLVALVASDTDDPAGTEQ